MKKFRDFLGVLMHGQQDDLTDKSRGKMSGNTNHSVGCKVECFEDEMSMLKAFVLLIRKYDPDILIGYEVQMSSIGYMIER